ncbi:MAG TPA: hypothetical protein P5184_11810, partial [Bacteroidales bacterium]|nr:hypothetical protein [Bacteroidales bacterium]
MKITNTGILLVFLFMNLLAAGQVPEPLLTSGQSSKGPEQGHTEFRGLPIPGPRTDEMLFDNGPLVNSPGSGQGGADESVVYDPLTLLAYPSSSPVRTADNFTVDAAGWQIDSVSFFDIIPNAPVFPSYFSGYFVRIWDGMPGQNGSHVIWGDRTTNRLVSSTWSGIYRVGDENSGGTGLAIFRNTCSTSGLILGPGEYWIEAQALA